MGQRYEVGQRIGRGGMADVFLARQHGAVGFVRLVVIKRMRPEFADHPMLASTIVDEARVLARLSHPNVLQVVDVGRDQDGAFLVVEYLRGETILSILKAMSAKAQAIPWPLVCRIGADLAAGLAAAHRITRPDGVASPIFHRDLTPSNVMVCYSGAIKLIDFGVAKVSGSRTAQGLIKGKPAYVAPEIVHGATWDHRCDLFQLGVVLHESLRGRRLFRGQGDEAQLHAVVAQPIPDLAAKQVPQPVIDIVSRLLQREPDRRQSSADEVRGELEGALVGQSLAVGGHEVATWLRKNFHQSWQRKIAMEKHRLSIPVVPVAETAAGRVGAHKARRRMGVALSLATAVVAGGLSHGQSSALPHPQPLSPSAHPQPLRPSAHPLPSQAIAQPLPMGAPALPSAHGPPPAVLARPPRAQSFAQPLDPPPAAKAQGTEASTETESWRSRELRDPWEKQP